MLNRFLLLLLLCGPTLCWSRDGKRAPTIDDLQAIRTASNARLSPDGKWFAYLLMAPDQKADSYVAHIWVVNVVTGRNVQLTQGEKSCMNPRWSPDGSWIAFSSNRLGDKNQLFVIHPDGGEGLVDPGKVACMGWSQGGYISAFLTTNSDRFKALSVGAGISNWAAYYYNTDITPFTVQYLGGSPAADPDIYAVTSPMSSIKRAKTPTLIQHGENDRRVPIANAYELRQGLEDQGVKAELVVYKGFGHGITKPKAMRAVMQHNLQRFNHYIFGDPLPDFTRPELPKKEPEKVGEAAS